MSELPKKQLINQRLQQARESLDEAQVLFQTDFWRGAINRAYYAMFYAALALAVEHREVVSKHTGVIAFFDREFVKSGVFSKDLSKSFHLAFQRRQDSDYGEIYMVNPEEAGQAIADAQIFVEKVEEHLRTSAH